MTSAQGEEDGAEKAALAEVDHEIPSGPPVDYYQPHHHRKYTKVRH